MEKIQYKKIEENTYGYYDEECKMNVVMKFPPTTNGDAEAIKNIINAAKNLARQSV